MEDKSNKEIRANIAKQLRESPAEEDAASRERTRKRLQRVAEEMEGPPDHMDIIYTG